MRRLTVVVVVAIVLTCFLFIAMTARQFLPGVAPADQLSSPLSESSGGQLIHRVDDGITYLNTMVALVGSLVLLMGLAAGLGIWQIRDIAPRIFREESDRFKREQVEPLIKAKRDEMVALSNQGLRSILAATDTLMAYVCEHDEEMYERQLQETGVSAEEKKTLLETRRSRHQHLRRLTQQQIASLSRNPDIATTACNDLGVVGDTSTLPHLNKLLDGWELGSPVRIAIIQAVEEIKERMAVVKTTA